MTRQPGGDGAVEEVEPEGDTVEEVVDLADPEQVLGRVRRQQRRRQPEHAAHLLLVAPQGAADRDPVDPRLGDELRRGPAQVLVDPALDDPEDGLARRALTLVPGEAAIEPAVGALGRARGVVTIRVIRGALVEGEGDVGRQRRLHLHRGLRREEVLGAVAVGAKTDAPFLDLDDRPLPLPPAAAALDLLGDVAVSEGEDLEAARVGDHRPLPADEGMQAAGGGDPLGPGRDQQVEGVAEHHLEPEAGDLGRVQSPHRALGGERDEGRGLDRAVGGAQHPAAGLAVAGRDLEPESLRVTAHRRQRIGAPADCAAADLDPGQLALLGLG